MKATRRELRNAVRNSRHVLEVLGPRAEGGSLTEREKLLVEVSREFLDLYGDAGKAARKVNAWPK